MDSSLPTSAQKVQQAINARGVTCQVVQMPASTRSAAEAAQTVGCTVGQIVKSLVFRTTQSGKPVLALVSGANRVSESLLAQYIGEPIEKANADFVREQTGFAIGGVPPVGHLQPMLTFIDQDLTAFDVIWAAAGTPNAVFKLSPADLLNLSEGKVVPLKPPQV